MNKDNSDKIAKKQARDILASRRAQKEIKAKQKAQKVIRNGNPDLIGKIAIKLDPNTTIYVSPEKDIDAVVAKWNNRDTLKMPKF